MTPSIMRVRNRETGELLTVLNLWPDGQVFGYDEGGKTRYWRMRNCEVVQ